VFVIVGVTASPAVLFFITLAVGLVLVLVVNAAVFAGTVSFVAVAAVEVDVITLLLACCYS
jgi:hypothetical protein